MTRLILLATFGTVLSALGHEWDSWQFWCMIALFWANQMLSTNEGYEQGVVSGMSAYCLATEQQRRDLDKIIKDNT